MKDRGDIWVTKNKQRFRVSDLSDSHLMNSMRLFEKRFVDQEPETFCRNDVLSANTARYKTRRHHDMQSVLIRLDMLYHEWKRRQT